jgi:hypothetical protein
MVESLIVQVVLIAGPSFAAVYFTALYVGVRTKPTEASLLEGQLWMVAHYKLVRQIPQYEAVSAQLLPVLILQARKDARRILALPLRPTAYFYWLLFWIVIAPLSLFCWLRPLRRLAASMELLWSSAMTGLLLQMGRCRMHELTSPQGH